MQIYVRLEALIGSGLALSHRMCESCLWISFFFSHHVEQKRKVKSVIIWLQGRIQLQLLNVP